MTSCTHGGDISFLGTQSCVLDEVALQVAGAARPAVEGDAGFALPVPLTGVEMDGLSAEARVEVGAVIVLHFEELGDQADGFNVQPDFGIGARGPLHLGLAGRDETPLDVVVESLAGRRRGLGGRER